MPTIDAEDPSNLPQRPDSEQRVLVLAGMIMDAQAAGSAVLEADWPEARFRVGLIREVAQEEGLSDIHEDAQAMDLAISQAEVGRPAGVGSAFDRLSRTIDHHLERGQPGTTAGIPDDGFGGDGNDVK